jgi:hypothetical protein
MAPPPSLRQREGDGFEMDPTLSHAGPESVTAAVEGLAYERGLSAAMLSEAAHLALQRDTPEPLAIRLIRSLVPAKVSAPPRQWLLGLRRRAYAPCGQGVLVDEGLVCTMLGQLSRCSEALQVSVIRWTAIIVETRVLTPDGSASSSSPPPPPLWTEAPRHRPAVTGELGGNLLSGAGSPR